MKKTILKSACVAVAAAASCFGAWKAYDAYQYEDNAMLMENVEALTSDNNPEVNAHNEVTVLIDAKSGPCYVVELVETVVVGGITWKKFKSTVTKNTWKTCEVRTIPANDPRAKKPCIPKICPPGESPKPTEGFVRF